MNNLESNDTDVNTLRDNQCKIEKTTKTINDRLNALQSQIKNLNETFSSNKQNQSSSYKVNNEYRNHPYNRTNKKPTTTTTIIARYDKPYRGICFGCGIQGHRFNDCTTIDTNKKEEIIRNYDSYLTKYKTDKQKKQILNFFGKTTYSQ